MWVENHDSQWMYHYNDDKRNADCHIHHHKNHGCVNNCTSNWESCCVYQNSVGWRRGKKSEICAHGVAVKWNGVWTSDCQKVWMIGQICAWCQSPLLFVTQWQDYACCNHSIQWWSHSRICIGYVHVTDWRHGLDQHKIVYKVVQWSSKRMQR